MHTPAHPTASHVHTPPPHTCTPLAPLWAGPLVLDVRDPTVSSLHPVPPPPNGTVLTVPMDTLRARVGEVRDAVAARGPAAPAPVTVCALGKTSYFAERVLAHHGVHAESLMGGLGALRGQPLRVRGNGQPPQTRTPT